jgi:Ca-activated chloride channel family protein
MLALPRVFSRFENQLMHNLISSVYLAEGEERQMYIRMWLTWTALSVILSGLAQSRGESERLPSNHANIDLVLVPVTVMDNKGANVKGLEREHFTILQDNVPQNIVSFSRQDVPCSVGVIVDTSGSVYRQLDAAKSAVRAFLETDEAFSTTFADRHAAHYGFTSNNTAVWNSPQSTRGSGSTALLDTLYLALSHLRSAHNPRRALLVVSDGIDNHSRYSKSELMRVAMEADAQIYSVSIGPPTRYKQPMKPMEEHDRSVLLDNLADRTGGLHLTVEYCEQASQAVAKLGQALRNQYVIGYRPHDIERVGKWHKIRVKLDVPKTAVYARSGYYSR